MALRQAKEKLQLFSFASRIILMPTPIQMRSLWSPTSLTRVEFRGVVHEEANFNWVNIWFSLGLYFSCLPKTAAYKNRKKSLTCTHTHPSGTCGTLIQHDKPPSSHPRAGIDHCVRKKKNAAVYNSCIAFANLHDSGVAASGKQPIDQNATATRLIYGTI